MKFIIALLLSATVAFAGSGPSVGGGGVTKQVVTNIVNALAGSGNPQTNQVTAAVTNQWRIDATNIAAAQSQSVFPPVTDKSFPFLIHQGFEGADGVSGGYDNGETENLIWTETGSGTIDQAYAGTVLSGSHSLRVNLSTENGSTAATFTSSDEVWIYFLLRPVRITSQTFILAIDGSQAVLSLGTGAHFEFCGSSCAVTVGSVTTNVTYHVWLHHKKGTGGNGVNSVAFSTNGIMPTSGDNFVETTSDNRTATVSTIQLPGSSGNVNQELIYDNIRVIGIVAISLANLGGVNTNSATLIAAAQAALVKKTNTIFTASIDGNGSVLSTGPVNGYTVAGDSYTISSWSITAMGASPTCTIDVWKIASGTALPTVANTIVGTKPALATGNVIESATLTSWTTTVTKGDIWGVNLDAVANATNITFQLFGYR